MEGCYIRISQYLTEASVDCIASDACSAIFDEYSTMMDSIGVVVTVIWPHEWQCIIGATDATIATTGMKQNMKNWY